MNYLASVTIIFALIVADTSSDQAAWAMVILTTVAGVAGAAWALGAIPPRLKKLEEHAKNSEMKMENLERQINEMHAKIMGKKHDW